MDVMPEHTIAFNGKQEWWLNGELHRLDGPAVIWPDGGQEWWQYGKLHRTDGPAYITAAGDQGWYVHDRNITDQIEAWMETKGITWPWDEETQTEFVLTWL